MDFCDTNTTMSCILKGLGHEKELKRLSKMDISRFKEEPYLSFRYASGELSWPFTTQLM